MGDVIRQKAKALKKQQQEELELYFSSVPKVLM